MPRPRHEPTHDLRTQIKAYATVGVPHHDIAVLVGLTTKTLLKYYRVELDAGKARGNATVARRLFAQATSGNLGAMIFWLKAQAGWREVHVQENRYPDGIPEQAISITHKLTADDAARAYQQLMEAPVPLPPARRLQLVKK